MAEPDVYEVRWLPIGEPVPAGWRAVPRRWRCHHDHYSVLIERVEEDAPAD